ncbi:MAG TPA: hypothetical protein VHV77_11165, partial [Pirellulales bacterium]|nr:hypothetical protein [Pirellulales bacterium]
MTTYGRALIAIVAIVGGAPMVAEAAKAKSEPAAKQDGATKTAPQTLVKLEVFPPDVNLATAGDRQAFIVTVTRADEITLDVTSK